MSWETDLQDWADSRSALPPSASEVDALLRRARAQRRRRITTTLSATTAVAIAAITLFWMLIPHESPSGWTWTPHPPNTAATDIAAAPEVTVPVLLPAGPHTLDLDHIEVSADASLIALQTGPITLLRLDHGQVDATVAPRTRSGVFSIAAGDYAVRVIGTQFSVQHTPFEVRVTEGTVSIEHPSDHRSWRVTAGEWFTNGRVHRPQKAPAPTIVLGEIQQLVLDNQLDTARNQLADYLRRHPDDPAGLRLLAQIETRSGRTSIALAVWERLIAAGPPADAQAARFEAARLLQDQPQEAIVLLEAFLATPHPLSGEARLQLADALIKIGENDRAISVLDDAARLHAGTAIGAEAQRRLDR